MKNLKKLIVILFPCLIITSNTIAMRRARSCPQLSRIPQTTATILSKLRAKKHPDTIFIACKDYKNITHIPALHWAILTRQHDLMLTLLQAHANPNLDFRTSNPHLRPDIATFCKPLTFALERYNIEDMLILLKFRANPNYHGRKSNKRTPLMVVIQHVKDPKTQAILVKAFLDAGARTDTPDAHGKTALDYAEKYGSEETLKLIQAAISQ